jgi:hypothetical protein
VRAFEAREAQASLEMQRAARDVAWVNERLVELLAEKGVERGEVDEFLRKSKEGGAAVDEDRRTRAGISDDAGNRVLIAPVRDVECQGAEDGHDSHINEDVNICDAPSKFQPQPKGSGTIGIATDGSRALTTSCDDAASIIAGFQGHGDVSHARNVLGCGDATDCHVKNTRLFQLMDEVG